MHVRGMFRLFGSIIVLLALLAGPAHGSGPSAEALAMIDELGLREARAPSSAIPDWQPARVIVGMLPGSEKDAQEYERALRAAAPGVEVVIARTNPFALTPELLAGADALIGMCTPANLDNADVSLRWVHNYSVGMDRCHGLSDTQRGQITFTNNQRLSAPAIAEHSLAMLLSLSRNLGGFRLAQARGEWARQEARHMQFGELSGKTMLVAGLGGIGTEVARRAHGLGMRVIATRNSSREGPDFVAYVGLADELHKLAGEADVVVNALPLTDGTTGLFDKAFFAAVKPGAIFISVGRGKSTVTSDLINALQQGQLFGAGLDVTEPEPLPGGHALWDMDNVIITPHIAAAGGDSFHRTRIISVENLRRYAAGEPLLNVVDIERGY